MFIRPSVYKFYSWCFNVDLSEAKEQDLYKYKNLGEFFYRHLKDGIRPIDESSEIVKKLFSHFL